MIHYLSLSLMLITVAPVAKAQSHPGIQQPSVDGCEGAILYDESAGMWVCYDTSSGGSSSTCSLSLCPPYCGVRNPLGPLGPSTCNAKPSTCGNNGSNCKCTSGHQPMPIAG